MGPMSIAFSLVVYVKPWYYSSALAFYDSYRSENLPANLIQAQRDLFGAHTYERTDRPRGKFFHTNWSS